MAGKTTAQEHLRQAKDAQAVAGTAVHMTAEVLKMQSLVTAVADLESKDGTAAGNCLTIVSLSSQAAAVAEQGAKALNVLAAQLQALATLGRSALDEVLPNPEQSDTTALGPPKEGPRVGPPADPTPQPPFPRIEPDPKAVG